MMKTKMIQVQEKVGGSERIFSGVKGFLRQRDIYFDRGFVSYGVKLLENGSIEFFEWGGLFNNGDRLVVNPLNIRDSQVYRAVGTHEWKAYLGRIHGKRFRESTRMFLDVFSRQAKVEPSHEALSEAVHILEYLIEAQTVRQRLKDILAGDILRNFWSWTPFHE